MNNYRKKMDAPLKKHAQLLTQIKANKQEALEWIESLAYGSRPLDEQLFENVVGFGWVCKNKDVYSSLPPMGNEDEFKWRYTIDEYRKLGQGGSAQVFKGWRLSDNTKVAIKKVKKSVVKVWGHVNGQLYPIEYCHLRMVDGCSRIANLLDAFEIGDEYIFVLETMDFCWDLMSHLLWNEKHFEEPRSRHIFLQLVEATEHCHKSGVFHRDIKLDNILIDDNTHEVKLMDFDISALACNLLLLIIRVPTRTCRRKCITDRPNMKDRLLPFIPWE